MAKNTALPLARFHVLDLTRTRASPTCVPQLVDWGAQAIKIEMRLAATRAMAWVAPAMASTSRTSTATSGA